MKYKYLFAVLLILTTLFLLGSAAAGETVNPDANSTENAYLSVDDEIPSVDSSRYISISTEDKLNDNTDNPANDSADNVDLSVDIKLGDVKKNTFGINQIRFDVPLIITAKANDGIAKNAKVILNMPEDVKFVSYDSNIGFYDHETGIWTIGDLNSAKDARLTIFTSISKKGNYLIYINSTTDSNDTYLANNYLECNIEVTSKITSNVTITSEDKNSPQHTTHYGSMAKGINRPDFADNTPEQNENSPSTDPNKETNNQSPHQGEDEGQRDNNPEGGIEGPQEESSSNTVSKEITTNTITNVVRSIQDTIGNILNSSSSSDLFDTSRIVKAIRSNDYITIPILIFALFLIGLIGEFAYEKIKT
ncbi:hypothetical protein [Methanobrevibacter sp.]|uniref:hypothetical protein n=1 Tax=Methanobrevibacter sp. TaxID=66852 RepID=UPI00386483FE